MKDFLYRGVFTDQKIRYSYGLTTDVVNDAVLAHDCDPVSAHILGRALTSAVLISPLLTSDERYTLRWNYSGILKSVVVDVGVQADVRGFIAPSTVTDGVANETDIYGEEGKVTLIKSTSEQVLSTGVVNAQLMDVVEDLTIYFAISDQVETAILVMIGFSRDTERPVDLCQGIMLQAMPDCDLTVFDRVRNRLQTDELRALIGEKPESDNYFELITRRLFDSEMRINTHPSSLSLRNTVQNPLDASPKSSRNCTACSIHSCPEPKFQCPCDREKILAISNTLGAEDLAEMEEKSERLKVKCQFCSHLYDIPLEDVRAYRKSLDCKQSNSKN